MGRALTKVGLVAAIAVLAGIATVVGLSRSRRTCRPVERSATVAAPPEAVQSRIADLQQWTTWSPWERPDAQLDRTFGGPESGPGASYAWKGGDDVGAGRMTVVVASPGRIHVLSEIERPRVRTSDFDFTLAPTPQGTQVTWTATCDQVATTDDIERGLARLKSAVEAALAVETYRVERSTTIEAAVERVQRRLVDLRGWTDWSVREALDRQMREQIAGPAMAPGSTYNWSGNDEVGSGRLTVIAVARGKVELEVRVDKPTASSSDLEFTLAPDGTGTRVTWIVAGEKDSSGNAFGIYAVPLDRLGDDMEACLAALRLVVEADARVALH